METKLAEKLDELITKYTLIIESLVSENKTLQEENDILLKHLEKNRVIFDVLIEQGYLGIAPSNLTRIKAI